MAKRKSILTKKHKEKLSDFFVNTATAWFVAGVIAQLYSPNGKPGIVISGLFLTGVFLIYSLLLIGKIKSSNFIFDWIFCSEGLIHGKAKPTLQNHD